MKISILKFTLIFSFLHFATTANIDREFDNAFNFFNNLMDFTNYHLNHQNFLLSQINRNEQQSFDEYPISEDTEFIMFPGNDNEDFEESLSTTTKPLTSAVQNCVESCILTTPGQYDPVCGSDEQDYHNEERLNCTRDCGVAVTLVRRGICATLSRAIAWGNIQQ